MTLRDYIYETVLCVGVYLIVAAFYWEKGFSAFGLFFLFLIVVFAVPIYLLIRPLFEGLPDILWFYPRDKFHFTVSMILSAVFVSLILSGLGVM